MITLEDFKKISESCGFEFVKIGTAIYCVLQGKRDFYVAKYDKCQIRVSSQWNHDNYEIWPNAPKTFDTEQLQNSKLKRLLNSRMKAYKKLKMVLKLKNIEKDFK